MLYLCDRNDSGEVLSIWKMDESIEDLLALFHEKRSLYERELREYRSNKRKLEYLSVRALLAQALGHDCVVSHDENGKPALPEENHLHISVTHTQGYAAILVSPHREVGLDIEQFSDKIFRVKHKFLNGEEMNTIDSTDKTQLLLGWCAKEAVYKLYEGLRPEYWEQVIIKKLDLHDGTMSVEVEDRPSVCLRFRMFPDFVMVHN